MCLLQEGVDLSFFVPTFALSVSFGARSCMTGCALWEGTSILFLWLIAYLHLLATIALSQMTHFKVRVLSFSPLRSPGKGLSGQHLDISFSLW